MNYFHIERTDAALKFNSIKVKSPAWLSICSVPSIPVQKRQWVPPQFLVSFIVIIDNAIMCLCWHVISVPTNETFVSANYKTDKKPPTSYYDRASYWKTFLVESLHCRFHSWKRKNVVKKNRKERAEVGQSSKGLYRLWCKISRDIIKTISNPNKRLNRKCFESF